MEYAQHDAHRSALSWPRALIGLALCAIAAVAALLVLTGSTGTSTPTAVTQSPDAARSALIEAGAPAADSPKQTAPQ